MHKSETKLIVRYAETDQMGIVHHAVYPIWYEAGRTDFIKKAGVGYSEIEKKGILLPLIELNVKYTGASHYEDEIIVETYLKEMTGTRITFGYYIIIKGQKKSVNEGSTSHVWTDTNLKPINLKKKNPDLFDLLKTKL